MILYGWQINMSEDAQHHLSLEKFNQNISEVSLCLKEWKKKKQVTISGIVTYGATEAS